MWRRKAYVYCYPEGGEGAGGAGAGAAGAGAAGAAGGAAGGGSAGGGAGAGAGAAGATLLSQAGGAAAAGAAAAGAAAADPNAWLPEKFRVFDGEGDAKKLNVEASAKKLAAEGYAPLEKRMGDAGAPPEKPEGYKNEAVLETLKKAAGANAAGVNLPDEFVKELNAWAHGAKLTQAQRDAALVAYVQGSQKMTEQAFDNAMASAQKELVKVWGAAGVNPESPQMQAAFRAFMTYAPAPMRTQAEMDKVGNNPIVLQILAAVGAEMKEDTRLNGEGGQGTDISTLMNSEPYWNKKHAEHQSTVKRVNEFFARGGKVQRAA